jgi:hypothetical protein
MAFVPATRCRKRLRMASGVSTRQHSKSQRGRARTNKSCGPDARGLCVKSCGDVAARPGARISHLQGDGGNSASLPGESTKDTLKPLRREGRAIRRTCDPPRVHFYRPRICGCQPAPGLPCALVSMRAMRRRKTRAERAARSRTLVRRLKRASARRLILPTLAVVARLDRATR